MIEPWCLMDTCCCSLGLKVNGPELREVFAKLVLQCDEPLRVVTRNIIEQCWKSEPITLHAESSGRLSAAGIAITLASSL